MKIPRIVIDTNVLVAGLRSNKGASYQLLSLIAEDIFEPVVSVPLVLEYESSLDKAIAQTRLTKRDVSIILDFLCQKALPCQIFYLWRPFLKDPKDDMVLEVAVASQSTHIVTFNTRDFVGIGKFGIETITPRDFLVELGVDL